MAKFLITPDPTRIDQEKTAEEKTQDIKNGLDEVVNQSKAGSLGGLGSLLPGATTTSIANIEGLVSAANPALTAQAAAAEPIVLRSLPTMASTPARLGGKPMPDGMRLPDMVQTQIPGKASTLTEFEGEYGEKIQDPQWLDWATKRATVLGFSAFEKDGTPAVTGGLAQFWGWIGSTVAANPNLSKSVTPEQYADMLYQQRGGDQTFDAVQKSLFGDPAAAENPIKTYRQVSRTTMNKGAAEAAVDELARNLLGRMASDAELSRYRKKINAFLASNPTVSTTTVDSTDPDNVQSTTRTKDGASAADAVNVLEMKLRRGSEGMAYNAGRMIEDAMMMMDRGL